MHIIHMMKEKMTATKNSLDLFEAFASDLKRNIAETVLDEMLGERKDKKEL